MTEKEVFNWAAKLLRAGRPTRLVFNLFGEYVPAEEQPDDGWYCLVEFEDGSHLPYPLVVLPEEGDEQGEIIRRMRREGLFDGVIEQARELGLKTCRYISPETEESLEPRLRGFFTVVGEETL